MKVKTPEQYAERYRRRGAERKRKWARDYMTSVLTSVHRSLEQFYDPAWRSKPNHTARAQSIVDVFQAFKPSKPKVDKTIPVVGEGSRCGRMLKAWEPYIDPEAFARGTKGRLEYRPYYYPCVVDHGMKRSAKSRFGLDLVSVTGKPGEHRDSLGRTW